MRDLFPLGLLLIAQRHMLFDLISIGAHSEGKAVIRIIPAASAPRDATPPFLIREFAIGVVYAMHPPPAELSTNNKNQQATSIVGPSVPSLNSSVLRQYSVMTVTEYPCILRLLHNVSTTALKMRVC